MAFSLSHDENLIEKTNVSLIINFSYMDMKSACHTENGLNADMLIGLKMQSMVKIYHLLGVLNCVLKRMIAVFSCSRALSWRLHTVAPKRSCRKSSE